MPRQTASNPPPRTIRPHPIHLALLALCGTGTTLAADPTPTLNPVVVTGSRVEAESFDLPFSVDSVDMKAVQEGNLGVNASEALNGIPGLIVQNRQNYAQDLQISVRGFGSRAAFGVRGVKLITDGIPASTPDGQGQAATFNLDTAERIEVMRGPFSTVYGNHAGGVIQLFSRDPKGAPAVRGEVLGGQWGTAKIGLGAEGERNGIGYLLDASRFRTDGYRDHSSATRDQAFAKIRLAPDADSKLQLVASGLRQHDTEDPLGLTWDTYREDPQAVESPAETFNTRKSIDHLQAGATYERRFGAARMQLTAYAGERSVIQYLSVAPGFQNQDPAQSDPANDIFVRPRHSGGVVDFDRQFYGLGARWIHSQTTSLGELTLTAGLDYDHSEDERRGYENYLGPAAAPLALGVKGALRRKETDTVSSLDPYVQANLVTGRWTLQAGLRHSNVEFEVDDDYINPSNPDDSGKVNYRKTTPAVGLVYQLTPLVNVYASAARGFETPTLTELSYSGTGGANGFNFDLDASTSKQIEIGAKAFIGEHTRLNAALFQIRTKDELVVESNLGGRTVFKNAAETLRQGVEVAADTEFTRNLRGRISLTRLRAIYDDNSSNDGNHLPGVPALSAYAEVEWSPQAGLAAAVEAQHRSKVYVEDTNDKRTAPAYTLVNLRLSAEQKQGHWTFGQLLRLDNVFDQEHIASVIVGAQGERFYEPGPTRTWYAGARATYSF